MRKRKCILEGGRKNETRLQIEINELEGKSSIAANVLELLILSYSVQYCFRQTCAEDEINLEKKEMRLRNPRYEAHNIKNYKYPAFFKVRYLEESHSVRRHRSIDYWQ